MSFNRFIPQMHNLRHLRYLRPLLRLRSTAANSCQPNNETLSHKFNLSKPNFDEKYLLDVGNIKRIAENIELRKGVGNIKLVHEIKNKLSSDNLSADSRISINDLLQDELRKIPNETHPEVKNFGDKPKVVAYFNEMPEFKHNPLEFSEITKKLNLLRTDYMGNYAGHKAYFLTGELAELVSWQLLHL